LRRQTLQPETLSVLFKEKTIADVLAMCVDEAAEFFHADARIHHAVRLLQDVGWVPNLGQQSRRSAAEKHSGSSWSPSCQNAPGGRRAPAYALRA